MTGWQRWMVKNFAKATFEILAFRYINMIHKSVSLSMSEITEEGLHEQMFIKSTIMTAFNSKLLYII
jgi:hypothetical protein